MTIDVLGHDLVHHDAKAPTCTEIGWDAYDTCSRCDYTTYVEKPALGHNYEGQEVTYTWSEDLSKCIASVECKNCSETLSETVSTSFIITKEPDDVNNITAYADDITVLAHELYDQALFPQITQIIHMLDGKADDTF